MRTNNATLSEKIRAVKNYLAGEPVPTIARNIGRHRITIYKWVRIYKERKSFDDLKERARSGRPAKVEKKIINKIEKDLEKPASKFGFETDLWTCTRVHRQLAKKYKIKISRGHVWKILKDAGFSYQKPERRYYESDPKAQEEWIKKYLPKIKRVSREHRAILYFEDEASISLTPVMGKTWAKKGKTPLVKSTARRGNLSALSAISKSGYLLFNLKRGRVNSDDVIAFLQQMLNHHKRRHLVVVMDRAPTHTSKKVKSFIKSQKRLHVFYLPPRSPELNPDEKVWNHLKNHELKGHQETNLAGLEKLSKKKLKKVSLDKNKVKGIFFRSNVAKFL